ncbi:hypothetical protein CONCODRAFT_9151, partial [Conidiobolus coronatus NRRL 28638]
EIIQENELDSDETKTLNVDKNLKIQNVEELLENLPGIVCKSFKDLRGTLTTKHKIILKDKNAKPIKHKVSRVPIALNNWLKEELENLERSGIISKTDSPWSFRVVLVPKPNGKTRIPRNPGAWDNPEVYFINVYTLNQREELQSRAGSDRESKETPSEF